MAWGGGVSSPSTFNEKLHWLRIHYRNEKLRDLADKWLVRDYVRERIGEQYLNEVYNVWNNVEDIDLEKLPELFVIKCSHGSGMNVIVRDRNEIDADKLFAQLRNWRGQDYSKCGREWVYSGRPRRILAERYLTDAQGKAPDDYKIFCFNGEPRMIQIISDRFGKNLRGIYDVHWKRLPFEYNYTMKSDFEKPDFLEEVLFLARTLSGDIPFVRVDFYALPKPVFGEMTFFPNAGTGPFRPAEWDRRVGEWLTLPSVDNH